MMKPKIQKQLINQMRQIQDSKNKRTSKLESFKKEIIILRHFNFTYKEISIWLDKKHKTKASLSQIHYMITIVWKDDPFKEKIKGIIKHVDPFV